MNLLRNLIAVLFFMGLYEFSYCQNSGVYDFIIKPDFARVFKFKEGVAVVRSSDPGIRNYGYIDKSGKYVIKPQFDDAFEFSEGLASVRLFDSAGFIDKQGKFVIPPRYNYAGNFSEGLAPARIGRPNTDLIGYIDKFGKFKIPQKFVHASEFSEGLASVCVKSGELVKCGYIDKQGKISIDANFEYATPFKDGLATVLSADTKKWGSIDKNGKYVIKPNFDNAFFFNENLAPVKIESEGHEKWGYIDKSGKLVIAPEFDAASGFSEGLAPVRIGNENKGQWGYINKSGKFYIQPKFDAAYGFQENLALVRVGNPVNGKYGYINRNGEFVISPEFEQAGFLLDFLKNASFHEGVAIACISSNFIKKCGVIGQTSEKSSAQLKNELEEKNKSAIKHVYSKFSVDVIVTEPDLFGQITIRVRTNADTNSIKINGEEQGGRASGTYEFKKIPRVGQLTQFTILVESVDGNTDIKTVTVNRKVIEKSVEINKLSPESIKPKMSRDAVAIIIGISDYKSLPKADFAKDDAQVFYDYAIRALGVKPENIRILLDADADEVEIFKAFKNWLPARVKPTTDVYVFYSGHGLPDQNGQGLYILPHRADRDLIAKTAIQLQEISADIQAAKPKSVTVFLDACYSGQARNGETLIASARPLALKAQTSVFPSSFNVITASQSDQISSSSTDLRHGIFSYYLMKGMEGDADTNKDGMITLGEMQSYLAENVGRQAGMMNRKQEPQLIGDPNRVLVSNR